MGLTVMLAVGVGLAALLGLRGVRPGLVAVAGTLLAAVLLDLWAEPLGAWVRATFRPEQPAAPTFALVGAAFLLTAGVLGYGGAALLEQPEDPGVLDRLVGVLLGALNGAMVGGYLLRYALASWGGGQAEAAVAGSTAAGLLLAWLPWYGLGLVAATGAIILARLLGRLAEGAAARRAAGSVASAPNLAEADRRLNEKIDQALRK